MRCPNCGSKKLWKFGFVPTKAGKKRRFKCTDCASSFYETKALPDKKPKKAAVVVAPDAVEQA